MFGRMFGGQRLVAASAVLPEMMQQAPGQPVQAARRAAPDEAHVTAVGRLLQPDLQ